MSKIITKFTKWLLTEGDHACHIEGCHTDELESSDGSGCHNNCH